MSLNPKDYDLQYNIIRYSFYNSQIAKFKVSGLYEPVKFNKK